MKIPELLCPAGGTEQLEAAVGAGCDAVYFGGGEFNARRNAENFDSEKIVKAVEYCRLFGVKAYITVNTVLTGRQLERAVSFVSFLEENAPPDAYIVQDLGLMSRIHALFPGAAIHASTQMALHSSPCVDIIKDYGVTRLICAREMARDDIARLCPLIETEVFVHGALCVSQSGGCLFSSMVGQNSGNCGKCAQPCRLEYRTSQPYPLSLKDNCLASHITELCDIGVASLKIEGRMKDAKYVYAVASVYRRLLDGRRNARPSELEYLSSAFSRSGFTDGYFAAKTGETMFGTRTEADKRRSRELVVDIKKPTVPVTAECVLNASAPASLTFSSDFAEFTAFGEIPQAARTSPLSGESVSASVTKLGATPFRAKSVSVTVGDGLNMPVSALNALRREAAEGLEKKIIDSNRPSRVASGSPVKRADAPVDMKEYTVLRFEGTYLPGDDSLGADFYDIPLNMIPKTGVVSVAPEKVRLIMPRVVFDSETENTIRMLDNAFQAGVRHAVVSNLSQFKLTERFVRHGNLNLNICNDDALAVVAPYLSSACVSPEIPESAVRDMKCLQTELVVYGKLPLMHTENCIVRRITGKCNASGRCSAYLTDRLGEKFFTIRETRHRNVIYNSRPLWLVDKADVKCGKIFLFTDESENIIKAVLCRAKPETYTRGYY